MHCWEKTWNDFIVCSKHQISNIKRRGCNFRWARINRLAPKYRDRHSKQHLILSSSTHFLISLLFWVETSEAFFFPMTSLKFLVFSIIFSWALLTTFFSLMIFAALNIAFFLARFCQYEYVPILTAKKCFDYSLMLVIKHRFKNQ